MKSELLSHSRQNRGIALILVLALVVLLTGLIVAFFSSVTSQTGTTNASTAQAEADVLADSAVQLAMAQIRSATQSRDPDGTTGLTWASQPGAIRTFRATNSGTTQRIYKLYSSDQMTVSSNPGSWNPGSDLPSGEFRVSDGNGQMRDYSALWTDLNSPVNVSTSGAAQDVYPIVNPSAEGQVEGFSVDKSVVVGSSGTRLPMPVRWIYLLKEGSLSGATGSPTTATMVTQPAESDRTGMITARIAFWADDESAKININTAAGGEYWDTPRANTDQERALGDIQPTFGEYQRYPGHPATVSLKGVFPGATDAELYNIAPRIKDGGSEGATKKTNIAGGAVPIATDPDRLYASVDELLYAVAGRGANSAVDANSLDRSRFFLTAASRAPEVTLFGTPRVNIWPIFNNHLSNTNAQKVTRFDALSAFCSTIAGNPYYFQRENPDSSSFDISIARNTQLLTYLERLTGAAVPGFGGNFASKYGADRDQILTQIFDYIRSTNLNDPNHVAANQFTRQSADSFAGTSSLPGAGQVIPSQRGTTMGFGRSLSISEVALGFICNAVADDTATGAVDESQGSNTVSVPRNPVVLADGEKRIQAIFVPEFFAPMLGYPGIHPDLKLEVEGLDAFTVTTGTNLPQSLGFPGAPPPTIDYTENWSAHHSRPFGGVNWRYFGAGKGHLSSAPYPLVSDRLVLSAPAQGGTMIFTGGPVTLTLKDQAGTVIQTLIVKIPDGTFPIPDLVDTATVSGEAVTSWWGFGEEASSGERLGLIANDPGDVSTEQSGTFFRKDYDVLRSIIPRHGDFRIVAATPSLDDSAGSLFIPHPDYGSPAVSSGVKIAASLTHALSSDFSVRDEARNYFAGMPGLETSAYRPDTFRGAPAADRPELSGDFDSGMPSAIDGPYLNKPDEGTVYREASLAANIPYFDDTENFQPVGSSYFSPHRILPSPGMFGSLPSRVKLERPWETLLFRPQSTHPNHDSTIPDHLFLDLFWMPVVEPFAISEPLSTAGKINMNYQIAPFDYITRDTGLRAVLRNEKVAAIPDTDAANYKSGNASATYRHPVNMDATLLQFDQKFASNQIFKSATEICDIHIVPDDGGVTAAGMPAYWNTHRLTGDNLRERIYTTLYPRLTTKSNVFTVYYRVQVLKQAPRDSKTSSTWYQWNENRDRVVAEQRGAVTIERSIDPTEAALAGVDFATDATASVDDYYRFRVLDHQRFSP